MGLSVLPEQGQISVLLPRSSPHFVRAKIQMAFSLGHTGEYC